MKDSLMQQVADELNAMGFDAHITTIHKNNTATDALTVMTDSGIAPAI